MGHGLGNVTGPRANCDTHLPTSEEGLDIQELKEVIQDLLGQRKQLELRIWYRHE